MRINKLNVFILMAVVLALPFITGCVNQPGIERAVVSAAVSKTGEPILASDNFTPDVNTIYCSIQLSSPSAKSTVRADWFLIKSEEAGLSNIMIGSGTVAAETPFVVCSFARAEAPLPRGEYMVKLYFDNKLAQSVPFQIRGDVAASTASVSEAVLCSSIDPLTGEPIGSVNIFPSDAPTINCSVKVSGANFSDQVRSLWVYMGGDYEGFKGKTVMEASTRVEGREYVSFSISRAEGKNFFTGDYNVKLYAGNKEPVSLDFKVVDPAALPALYIGEVATLAYKDSEKKVANLTAQFPADAADIIFRAKIYNAPPGTPMSIRWVIVRSEEAGLENEIIKEDKYMISGTDEPLIVLTRGKDNFPKGDYAIKLLLNGEEKVVLPFKVQ